MKSRRTAALVMAITLIALLGVAVFGLREPIYASYLDQLLAAPLIRRIEDFSAQHGRPPDPAAHSELDAVGLPSEGPPFYGVSPDGAFEVSYFYDQSDLILTYDGRTKCWKRYYM